MLKISDFSRLAQVPSATLRYYDQLGLLKPAHVDRFTDYRYYEVNQLSRLNRILALKDLGFSLDQIAELLQRDVAPAELRGMLTLRRADAERELRESQQRLALVEARLLEIEREGLPSPFDIVTKHVDPFLIVSTRELVAHADDMASICDQRHARLRSWLSQRQVRLLPAPAPQLVNLYHNSEYTETDLDVEVAVLVAKAPMPAILAAAPMPLAVREVPRRLVASGILQGQMQEFGLLVRTALMWVATSGYALSGPVRELHLAEQTATGEALVEVQIPIEPIMGLDSQVT